MLGKRTQRTKRKNEQKKMLGKFMTISRPAAFSSILSIHLLFYPITQHILHYNAPMVELIVKNGTVFLTKNISRVDLLVAFFFYVWYRNRIKT